MMLTAAQLVAPWCLLVFMLAIAISLLRLLRGPTAADRLVALDLVTVLSAGVMGALAVGEDSPTFVIVALVIALISFLGTVALALYVGRRARSGEHDHER